MLPVTKKNYDIPYQYAMEKKYLKYNALSATTIISSGKKYITS